MSGEATAVPSPGSCSVHGWAVFGPGFHKNKLYTPAACKKLVENFRWLSTGADPWVKAKGKLGHDDEQRLAKSLGYPSCGNITACRLNADGMIELDLDDVPLALGGEINAGRINDGSVEIIDDCPDPSNPAKYVDGPVLTGVAFLGEEQPAVKGCPPPKATMAGGSPVVPGENKAQGWLKQLMSQSARKWNKSVFSVGGRPLTTRIVRFSEVIPMRDQLIQQLADLGIDTADPGIAAMSDDQLQAMLTQITGGTFAAKFKAKLADPPKDEPKPDEMAAKFSKFMEDTAEALKPVADMSKRMSAVEAAMSQFNGLKAGELQAAAKFSQDYRDSLAANHKAACEREIDSLVSVGKIMPADKQVYLDSLLARNATKKFSEAESKANAGKTDHDVFVTELRARPVDARFSAAVADPIGDDSVSDSFVVAALKKTPQGRQTLAGLKAQAKAA